MWFEIGVCVRYNIVEQIIEALVKVQTKPPGKPPPEFLRADDAKGRISTSFVVYRKIVGKRRALPRNMPKKNNTVP